ncbi:hypothetical protein [Helicobacter mesocricetorum]|uniref:hypothetical protein n=1 Tax=Helicobacter mesocricetorum TaxID=87012 RepID=UPI0013156682|nr:hypothetical protein [Helicobacter mesocricetorum]
MINPFAKGRKNDSCHSEALHSKTEESQQSKRDILTFSKSRTIRRDFTHLQIQQNTQHHRFRI